jgi:hypothetical protein
MFKKVLATGLTAVGLGLTLSLPAHAVGAVVRTERGNSFFWSWNYHTEPEAVDAAMSDCVNAGFRDCQVMYTYWNQAVAIYASPDGAWGLSIKPTMELATNEAIATCQGYSEGAPCTRLVGRAVDTVPLR